MANVQKRHWMVTVWPKHIGLDSECSEEEIIDGFRHEWEIISKSPNLRYLGGQVERAPDTGNLHIQAYIEFKCSYRQAEVLRNFTAHIEPRKGSRDEARSYCRSKTWKGKDKGRICLLQEHGEWRIEKTSGPSPKQRALLMLKTGFSPSEILLRDPDVYFTHYRSIEACYNLMSHAGISLCTSDEEE